MMYGRVGIRYFHVEQAIIVEISKIPNVKMFLIPAPVMTSTNPQKFSKQIQTYIPLVSSLTIDTSKLSLEPGYPETPPKLARGTIQTEFQCFFHEPRIELPICRSDNIRNPCIGSRPVVRLSLRTWLLGRCRVTTTTQGVVHQEYDEDQDLGRREKGLLSKNADFSIEGKLYFTARVRIALQATQCGFTPVGVADHNIQHTKVLIRPRISKKQEGSESD